MFSMQLNTIASLGIEISRPIYENVKIPPDITLLDSEALAAMFTVLTGWADFFASKFAEAQVNEKNAEDELEYITDVLTVEVMRSATKTDKVTLFKAQIAIDPKVREAKEKQKDAYATRKAWEMLLGNQERDLTLVSREITRRTNDQRALRKDYI